MTEERDEWLDEECTIIVPVSRRTYAVFCEIAELKGCTREKAFDIFLSLSAEEWLAHYYHSNPSAFVSKTRMCHQCKYFDREHCEGRPLAELTPEDVCVCVRDGQDSRRCPKAFAYVFRGARK